MGRLKKRERENSYFRALESEQWVSQEGQDLLIYNEGFDAPLRFSRLTPSSSSVKND